MADAPSAPSKPVTVVRPTRRRVPVPAVPDRLDASSAAAGVERRVTAHSGRVGLASELTSRGASTTDVMRHGSGPTLPRGWCSPARSARPLGRHAAGPPRWGVVARAIAARVGAPAGVRGCAGRCAGGRTHPSGGELSGVVRAGSGAKARTLASRFSAARPGKRCGKRAGAG